MGSDAARATVRRYLPADERDVLQLAERLAEHLPEWRRSEAVRAAIRAAVVSTLRSESPSAAVFVAVRGGTVVGFVSATEREHFAGPVEGWIEDLAVAAEVEGTGVGRALLAEACRWAAERGLQRVSVETTATNRRALALYSSAGFEPEDVRMSAPTARR